MTKVHELIKYLKTIDPNAEVKVVTEAGFENPYSVYVDLDLTYSSDNICVYEGNERVKPYIELGYTSY